MKRSRIQQLHAIVLRGCWTDIETYLVMMSLIFCLGYMNVMEALKIFQGKQVEMYARFIRNIRRFEKK